MKTAKRKKRTPKAFNFFWDATDTQLMVMAAHRYCLGRRSYIVGSCQEWMKNHWFHFADNTKIVMVRDTIEALMDDAAGSSYDVQTWLAFAKWCWAQLTEEQQNWVFHALTYKRKPWPLDENDCEKCGRSWYTCVCPHDLPVPDLSRDNDPGNSHA